ncbi:DHS-like NAD/FAD-binding domain-containing protein [Xylariaceae sp. FL0255]|nr:DHS-like NAD/FAD-binding domain-containing protein [Xylariaceae sp. FL0255]
MGQSASDNRTIPEIAGLIDSGKIKNIVVMTGAGISTAAGIPDFRSPETGLYHNLSRLNLPHPEAVFDIDFFRNNPWPFYVLAKELYPGNFHPTISHTFIALLAKKKLLRKLFTQNIDCLERAAGVPPEFIIEAHGSFATQRCVECKTPFPDDEMREHVKAGKPPRCHQKQCESLVKPDIVFFGEPLPLEFHRQAGVPEEADLVIIMGTSLTVYPFAALPRRAKAGVPRILFNMEQVGDFGTRRDDILCLGECDEGIRMLAEELGWGKELYDLWVSIVGQKEADRQDSKKGKKDAETEVDELVRDVESKLGLSDDSTSQIASASTSNKTKEVSGALSEDSEVVSTQATHDDKTPIEGSTGETPAVSSGTQVSDKTKTTEDTKGELPKETPSCVPGTTAATSSKTDVDSNAPDSKAAF